jgi:hypothetical protein
MKIAIISANIGGIDNFQPIAKQKEKIELCYYTENNLPFPLPNIDNRMKGKYLKTQPHTFLNHDIFIWIDACVEIKDGTFATWILEKLKHHEFISSPHPDRDNVYDELDYIVSSMKRGSNYLLERYAKQPFKQEKEFYREEGLPEYFPLYNGWFYACRNNERMNKVFNQWWELTLRYSNFDQSQLAFVLWKHRVNVLAADVEPYLVRHLHKDYKLPSVRDKIKQIANTIL